MFDDAADVEQRRFRKTTIEVTGKQVLAIFEQRLVHMHAVAVVIDQRLGHECRCLAVRMSDVVDDIFENLHLVCFAH